MIERMEPDRYPRSVRPEQGYFDTLELAKRTGEICVKGKRGSTLNFMLRASRRHRKLDILADAASARFLSGVLGIVPPGLRTDNLYLQPTSTIQ